MFNIQNTKVLVRVDYNLPTTLDNIPTDFYRIQQSLETIKTLIKQNNKVILISHFKNPNLENLNDLKNYSFQNLFAYIKEYFAENNLQIEFIKENIFEQETIDKINNSINDLILLENIRFYKEELENDINLIYQLKKISNIYINEAFSVSHRNHASISSITEILPSYFGINFKEELNKLSILNDNSNSKIKTAIIGGKKVSTKIKILESLSYKMNNICIVGGMANTFLKYFKRNIGSSFYEENVENIIHNFMSNKRKECNIILPEDFIFEDMKQNSYCIDIKQEKDIKQEYLIKDIGSKTKNIIKKIIDKSDIIIWNGPAGIYEELKYAFGTFSIAMNIYNNNIQRNLHSIIGGGDTIAAINNLENLFCMNIQEEYTHISTGGGAFLDWIEKGDNMIGIKSILCNNK